MNKYNNPLREEEKKIIVELFNKGYNTVYIAKQLKRNSCSIQRFLNKNDYELRANKINLTPEEEKSICELYLDEHSTAEIAKMFYPKIKCDHTVAKILRRNNIELRKAQRIVKITNEDFFEDINSEEKGYSLGLFISDGCVREDSRGNRSKLVGITLQIGDEYMVKKIKELLGVESRKLYYGRKEVMMECSSNKLASDLSKYGVIERKTFNTYVPEIDKKYYRDMIRGIFDGDSIVSYSRGKFYFGFCGTKKLVTQIKEHLLRELNVNDNAVTFNKSNSIYYVQFSRKKDIINFYNYIYTDANIYLDRKKEKFENYFKRNNINYKHIKANTEVTKFLKKI